MTKHLTNSQIETLLGEAKAKFRLSHSDKEAIRGSLMKQIHGHQAAKGHQTNFSPARSAGLRMLVPAAMAIVIAISSGAAAFANSAKPGDTLYPVDRFVEKIETHLVTDPNTKAQLFARLSEERAQELVELQAEGGKAGDEDQAAAGVVTSIEQSDAIEALFQAKVDTATDDKQKALYRKVLDHLKDSANRRSETLKKLNQDGDTNGLPFLSPDNKSKIDQKTLMDFRPEHPRDENEAAAYEILRKSGRLWSTPDGKNPPPPAEDLPSMHRDPSEKYKGRIMDSDKPTSSTDKSNDEDADSTPPTTGGGSGAGTSSCSGDTPIQDPYFPGICYGNNSLIHSGANQILTPAAHL